MVMTVTSHVEHRGSNPVRSMVLFEVRQDDGVSIIELSYL